MRGILSAPSPGTGPRARDWFASAAFLPVFGSTLMFFDPLQRLARCLGTKSHERVVLWLNMALVYSLRLVGTRISIEQPVVRPKSGPIIIVSNHQSLFDIPLLYSCFRRFLPRFVAKRELSRWIPSVSYNLRRGGNAIIDRQNPLQAVRALRALGRRMSAKKFATVFFPEGTRARAGVLRNFKVSGFDALCRTAPEATVIPVAIDGSWKLAARRCLPIPWGCTVKIAIGEPISGLASQSPEEVLSRCRAFIAAQVGTQ